MPLLNPGDPFPKLTISTTDGQAFTIPDAFAGGFSVVLFYRGSWCPYCNAQLRAFERASSSLALKTAFCVACCSKCVDCLRRCSAQCSAAALRRTDWWRAWYFSAIWAQFTSGWRMNSALAAAQSIAMRWMVSLLRNPATIQQGNGRPTACTKDVPK